MKPRVANSLMTSFRGALGGFLIARDNNIRRVRRFIGLIDAGEILDLAGDGALCKAPSDRARCRSSSGVSTKISMNSPALDELARHVPLGPERRNERAEHDQARLGHQFGDFADAADIFDPVGFGEAQDPC